MVDSGKNEKKLVVNYSGKTFLGQALAYTNGGGAAAGAGGYIN